MANKNFTSVYSIDNNGYSVNAQFKFTSQNTEDFKSISYYEKMALIKISSDNSKAVRQVIFMISEDNKINWLKKLPNFEENKRNIIPLSISLPDELEIYDNNETLGSVLIEISAIHPTSGVEKNEIIADCIILK
jgi:hypothetical protein